MLWVSVHRETVLGIIICWIVIFSHPEAQSANMSHISKIRNVPLDSEKGFSTGNLTFTAFLALALRPSHGIKKPPNYNFVVLVLSVWQFSKAKICRQSKCTYFSYLHLRL